MHSSLKASATRLVLAAFAAATASVATAQNDRLPPPTEAAPGTEPAGAAGQPVDPRFNEKVSYCLGLDLGKRLKADDVPVDLGAIVAGIRDALSGAEPQLNEQQTAAVMDRFLKQMQQKAESKMAQAHAENLAIGEKFLAENRTKEGVQETESGLQYRVIEEGTGESPGPTDTVSCHYEGKIISGEVFDSSYKRGQPASFPVNRVIDGWTEALQMMKVGSKWEVFLPSKIAYGQQGAPGAIGPNETLIFQIELLDIVD